MKAIIKVCCSGPFTQDQKAIIKRTAMVLSEHLLSVAVIRKSKTSKKILRLQPRDLVKCSPFSD
jgi:hypothetical protein